MRLLDTATSPGYLAAGAQRYAQHKTETRATTQSAVVFRVAGEWLALATAVFQQVAPLRPVHSLPHRRGAIVSGIVNIRGELLVCVSVSAALGITAPREAKPAPTARHVVIGAASERLVFAADEIAGLHRYDAADITPVPATLAHAQAVHTRGFLACEKRPVALLDEGLLFHTFNRGLG
jgi:chemotaxis-related protein WspD